jgi:4-diphosphocytidyl-2-C-methyl-D-erythritol kinase
MPIAECLLMIDFPCCKINLGLHVLFKRSDGYHDIETCFYPVSRTDILEVIPHKVFSFAQSGIKIEGNQEDNLCVRAFRLLQTEFGITEAEIHLHKIIPMGAGLGGGSSDAAFTLKLLNQVFDLRLTRERLIKYAAQLGSDCAFFIGDQPMIGMGRGEILSPASVSLKGYHLVLVKPEVHISTAEAYSGIKPKQPENSIAEVLNLPIQEWKEKLKNDFETSIFQKYSVVKDAKAKLYSLGAIYSSMSGSGASVFGVFDKPIDLKKEFLSMDYWSGELK